MKNSRPFPNAEPEKPINGLRFGNTRTMAATDDYAAINDEANDLRKSCRGEPSHSPKHLITVVLANNIKLSNSKGQELVSIVP